MSSALFTLSASETQADSGVMGRMSSGAKLFHGSFTNAPKMQDSLVCLQVFDVSHDGDCSLAEVAREVTLLKRFCKQQRNIANFEGAAHDPKTETVTVVLACKNSNTLRSAILEFNFPWDLRIHICTDIVAALEAVHAAGMCHRNVSPSHILIDDKWHAYVAGFSDCVREAASPSDTGMTIVLGDAFHSPEYAMHVSQLRSTDIFSLGAVMYSLVTFESEDISDEEALNQVDLQNGGPFSGSARTLGNEFRIDDGHVREGLNHIPSTAFRSLIARCCSQDASARPTASECSTALISIGIIGEDEAGPGPQSPPQASPERRTSGFAGAGMSEGDDDGVRASTYLDHTSQDADTNVDEEEEEHVDKQPFQESNLAAAVAPAPALPALAHSEMIELKALVADMRQEMKLLRDDNKRMQTMLECKEAALNIGGITPRGAAPATAAGTKSGSPAAHVTHDMATFSVGAHKPSNSDKELKSVLDSFLHVIQKCAATPDGSTRSAVPDMPPAPPSIPSAPSSPSKWMQSVGRSGPRGLTFNDSTAELYNASRMTSTPSSGNRQHKSKNSTAQLEDAHFKESVRKIGCSPQKYSKVPISRRRLHPDIDPRTPPKRGPGARPSKGEIFRSVGSSGTPHFNNTDTKLARNWFRADDADLNRQRFQEYHSEKHHKHVKNAVFMGDGSGGLSKTPSTGIMQADMAVTASLLRK